MVIVPFFILDRKKSFLGKFGQKIKNCQLKVKFCTQTNSNIQNSVAMLNFLSYRSKHHFEKIGSHNSKLFALKEIQLLDQFKYAEFNDDLHFFRFRPAIHFLSKFDPKNIKIGSLSQIFRSRLIQIFMTQW